jgi:hypothetical protein
VVLDRHQHLRRAKLFGQRHGEESVDDLPPGTLARVH